MNEARPTGRASSFPEAGGRRPPTETSDFEIRTGIHTGEIELRGNEVSGIAVHIAARRMAEAAGGEIIASSTVKDLVTGSDINFMDRGVRALKGVPTEWRLSVVA